MIKKIIVFLLLLVNSGISQVPNGTATGGSEGGVPTLNFGWSPPKTQPPLTPQDVIYSNQLKELVKYNDEDDALTYRVLYKALEDANLLTDFERQTKRLASLDQGETGSCVSFGATRALSVTAACDIYVRKEKEIYKYHFNPNAIYGIIRFDNLGNWDGANGSLASEALKKYGTLHNIEYGEYDLTNSTPQDARRWAAKGLPKELIEAAKDHQVIASALVTTPEEVKAALSNGYGVIVCSHVGYSSTRDAQGFARRSGSWAHCMAVIAYRGPSSGREGYLISNSWGGPGGTWIDGPIWPEDMVYGSFWVTPEDLKMHLRERDSYAIAGYNGFKRRNLKWNEIFQVGKEINVNDN